MNNVCINTVMYCVCKCGLVCVYVVLVRIFSACIYTLLVLSKLTFGLLYKINLSVLHSLTIV